ncbi:MAG: RNA methyltransferase [Bacteroidales bacterium]
MKKLKTEQLNRIDIKTFKNAPKTPIIVVLDNIRSLNNIGSVFRTSDAFRIETICLCGITCTPPHREINKTALGATESVEWKYFNTTEECIKELRKNNTLIIGIEQTDQSISLNNYTPPKNKKLGVIFGNEVFGIDDNIIDLLDISIEIPQIGTKHSLNVAVCCGIVLYDLFIKLNS